MRRSVFPIAVVALLLAACSGDDQAQPAPTTPPATSTPGGTQLVYATANPCPSSVCAPGNFEPSRLNDLWLVDTTAGTQRRLTSDGARLVETLPQFTGTGTVSFVEGAEEQKPGSALFEVPLAGGAATELLRLAATEDVFRYDWSPDGSTVALIVFSESGASSLRVWSRTDRTVRRIKALPEILGRGVGDIDEVSVAWSPDGSMILVVDTFASPASRNTLWVVRTDGKDVVPARDGTFGRWLKDGTSIVYRGFERTADWYRLEVAGDAATRTKLAIPRNRLNPTLSPDGTRLALHDAVPLPSSYIFDLAAGTERRLGPGVVPVWISNDAVAVTDVRACTASEECGEGPKWRPTGTASRVSVADGTATKLFDGWALNADVDLA